MRRLPLLLVNTTPPLKAADVGSDVGSRDMSTKQISTQFHHGVARPGTI